MTAVEKIIQSGVAPLELLYKNIVSVEFGDTCAYRSILRVNSAELGSLMPEQYMGIALRNSICLDLFYWNFSHLCQSLKAFGGKESNTAWVSLNAPVRALSKPGFIEKLNKLMADADFHSPEKICLEFSEELLFGDAVEMPGTVKKLKEAGFLIAVNGYGGEFSPLLRLSNFAFDFVLTDDAVARDIERGGTAAPAVLKMIEDTSASAVVGGASKEMLPRLFSMNVFACCGKISGGLKKRLR